MRYTALILIICLLILGYLLMSGGGSDNPDVFREDIFNFRRITLAPVIIFVSYVALFLVILKKRSFDIQRKK
jgi:hypothetical protein